MNNISHSEACAYLDCQKKWDLIYNKGLKKSSPHMEFGVMAHKVLETRDIPDENLFLNLKLAFGINSWSNYFNNIFKELDNLLKDYDIINKELKIKSSDGITGVIDLVCKHKVFNTIYLFDYKFTSTAKDYTDIFLDEQLKIYAYLYSSQYWVNIDKIIVGYISIPKTELQPPQVLKNGSLSKNKSQFTSRELYIQTINKLGLKITDYEDIINSLQDYIHLITSRVDAEQCHKTVQNLLNISKARDNNIILENMSSTKCKNCDFLKECKYG